MKPVDQTVDGGENAPLEERGDCMRACVASILELPPESLPNPHGEHWWDAWQRAVGEFGFHLIEWDVPTPEGVYCELKGYWIGTVPSRNLGPNEDGSPTRHCIVMKGHKIAHDPARHGKRTDDNWAEGDKFFSATVLVPLDPAKPVPTPHRWTTGT